MVTRAAGRMLVSKGWYAVLATTIRPPAEPRSVTAWDTIGGRRKDVRVERAFPVGSTTESRRVSGSDSAHCRTPFRPLRRRKESWTRQSRGTATSLDGHTIQVPLR